MNLKNVLKTYSLLRSLSDDESALLDTLRGLSDSEREQLVETMTPVKVAVKPTRQIKYCVANVNGNPCNISRRGAIHKDTTFPGYHEFQLKKSRHQQSLSSAIQREPKGKVVDAESNSDNQQPCIAYADDNGSLDLCGKFADDNVHHLQTHPDYHEFIASEKAQTASGD